MYSNTNQNNYSNPYNTDQNNYSNPYNTDQQIYTPQQPVQLNTYQPNNYVTSKPQPTTYNKPKYIVTWSTLSTICCVFTVISTIICLSIYFPIVFRDQTRTWNYVETTCTFLENIIVPSNCCKISNCNCQSTDMFAPLCSNALLALQQTPSCNNGAYCCRSDYDTCTRQVPYTCSTDSTQTNYNYATGVTTRSTNVQSSTCYRNELYNCNYHCVQQIYNQQCSTVCGTCYSLTSKYSYLYKEKNIVLQKSISQNCGQNDNNCLSVWLTDHQVSTSKLCYYDNLDAEQGALFTYPNKPYNKTAVVFTWIFLVLSIIFLITTVVVSINF
jgi:hypothetical protein